MHPLHNSPGCKQSHCRILRDPLHTFDPLLLPCCWFLLTEDTGPCYFIHWGGTHVRSLLLDLIVYLRATTTRCGVLKNEADGYGFLMGQFKIFWHLRNSRSERERGIWGWQVGRGWRCVGNTGREIWRSVSAEALIWEVNNYCCLKILWNPNKKFYMASYKFDITVLKCM